MIRGMMAPSFMDLALKTAKNAGKAGEVPIGCVIVRDGEVVAAAGNRTLTDRDPTAHAEVLAIREASRMPSLRVPPFRAVPDSAASLSVVARRARVPCLRPMSGWL